jgi:GNAT superfamily N-acetyltransferase
MDDKVVGFIYARKEDAYTEIRAIYLLQEAKGKGLGGRMMDEFLAWADKDKPCSLKIFITNEKTLGFYKKYGFEQTEKLPEKFTDKFLFVEMVKPRV